MKDIFSPIFLFSLALLSFVHQAGFTPGLLPPLLLLTAPAAAILYAAKKYKASYRLLAFSFALLLSFAFLEDKEDFQQKQQVDVPPDMYITIEGKLRDYPQIGREESVLYLAVDTLEYGRKRVPCAFNIRLTVKGDLRHLDEGDTISAAAKLYNRQSNRNFYPNPFDDYLLYNKIHAAGYCKSAALIRILEKTGFFRQQIGAWRNKIRAAIEKKYQKPGGLLDKKGVLLEAILIGDRGRIENNLQEELLDAGIFHLLAISGAHIGIISLFLLFFLQILGIRYNTRYIITGVFLVLFLILSGSAVSAQRAVLMALLIFTARLLYAEFEFYNVISFCGLILLFKNPAEFLAPGFILTFALTAAIVAGRLIFLPMLSIPRLKNIRRFFKEFLSANFSASLVALPLSFFYFKRYSFAGFFAGILLFPMIFIITAGGLVLIFLAPLSAPAANLLLYTLDLPLRVFFMISGIFSGTINLTIYRASPPLLVLVLILGVYFAYPAIRQWQAAAAESKVSAVSSATGKTVKTDKTGKTLLTVLAGKTRKISSLMAALVFILGMLWITFAAVIFPYRPGHLETFFLDVGQGDCQVVVFPGGEGLLIDGGGTYDAGFEVGKQVVLPFLIQKKIAIRWVAVSHYHPDHARGITEIIDIIRPDEVWLSSAVEENSFYQNLVRHRRGCVIRKVDASFKKVVGDCLVQCLSPEAFITTAHPGNDDSQVLRVSDGSHAFLFAGDIEWAVESALVSPGSGKMRANVLKVPHHGSRSSSSARFLQVVSPQLAIYSYASNNRFGFPHEQVKRNYRRLGIMTLSTAQRGGIRVVSLSQPDRLLIETSR